MTMDKKILEEMVEFFNTKKYFTKAIQRRKEIEKGWNTCFGSTYEESIGDLEDYKEFIKNLNNISVKYWNDNKECYIEMEQGGEFDVDLLEVLYSILSRK